MEFVYRSGSQQNLWQPSIYPVYLFYGEEDLLKEEAVSMLGRQVTLSDFADFDFEVLDASRASAESILAAAQQMPFGSPRRMVVVKHMEQWRERARSSDCERLGSGLRMLGEAACLVLIVGAEEDEAKRKTAISPKFDSAVKAVGALVAFRGITGEALAKWIGAKASERGKHFEVDALESLIAAAGTDTRVLQQEVNKLVCYLGERKTILAEDVDCVVARTPEDVMFPVVEAMTRFQTDRSLQLLEELQRYDPKPQAIAGRLLTLLGRQYRLLWQAKFLAEMRIQPRDVRSLPTDLSAELPAENSIVQVAFRSSDLFSLSRQYSWDDVNHALECLLRCDLANKGGVTEEAGPYSSDPVANLQLLVLELTCVNRKQQAKKTSEKPF